MKMGHGDELVISDGNFPAESVASKIIVRCDGHNATTILKDILKLMPLDDYDDCVMFMEPMERDKEVLNCVKQLVTAQRYPGGIPPIWSEYMKIVEEEEGVTKYKTIERFAFYKRAKKAFVVVYTSEAAQYANIILKKGCIKEPLSGK